MAKSKPISVKIATVKVIKALEDALAKLNKEYEAQEANEAKYQKALEKYRKEVHAIALANLKNAENVRTAYRAWSNTLNIDFDVKIEESKMPKEPLREFIVMKDWEYAQNKEEISNAIRILKMTDEEVVNTSTYNAVARYL